MKNIFNAEVFKAARVSGNAIKFDTNHKVMVSRHNDGLLYADFICGNNVEEFWKLGNQRIAADVWEWIANVARVWFTKRTSVEMEEESEGNVEDYLIESAEAEGIEVHSDHGVKCGYNLWGTDYAGNDIILWSGIITTKADADEALSEALSNKEHYQSEEYKSECYDAIREEEGYQSDPDLIKESIGFAVLEAVDSQAPSLDLSYEEYYGKDGAGVWTIEYREDGFIEFSDGESTLSYGTQEGQPFQYTPLYVAEEIYGIRKAA